MKELPKVLETKMQIRFQHCDPFNHLNNAEYLNYMVNAREDQLIQHYGIDIYKMGREVGKSWVVGTNQIAYIRPAYTMENVLVETQMLSFSDSSIKVELKMFNEFKTELKAMMWSEYVHFNLLTQKRELHSEEFMNLFNKVVNPVQENSFEERLSSFKKQQVSVKA
ncbi:MAG: acyl-CoA thioesterase [Flavobacteriaceae bacterium]|nr:acyl-CoA thioesterase [Flavobacteriaceae bacterium]